MSRTHDLELPALYAGLRYGELRALRWGAVKMAAGVIEVRESWDPKEGPIDPKTRRSRRTVPLPGVLRPLLNAQRAHSADTGERALVFAVAPDTPFEAERLYRLADSAWEEAGVLHDRRRRQPQGPSPPSWATPRSRSPSTATAT